MKRSLPPGIAALNPADRRAVLAALGNLKGSQRSYSKRQDKAKPSRYPEKAIRVIVDASDAD